MGELNALANQDRKVFIGGLSWETTNEKLKQYFENFGPVEEAFVNFDRRTGRPRGFGFVVFNEAQIADKVVALKHTIDRREVEAKKAVPKQDQPGGCVGTLSPQASSKVFVGGLPPTVDDATFKRYFEQYGPVKDAVVMYEHDTKRPRGFGFVTFVHPESITALFGSGKIHRIGDKNIEIKLAVPKDQMPVQKRPIPGVLQTTQAVYAPTDLSLYNPYIGLQQAQGNLCYQLPGAATYQTVPRISPTLNSAALPNLQQSLLPTNATHLQQTLSSLPASQSVLPYAAQSSLASAYSGILPSIGQVAPTVYTQQPTVTGLRSVSPTLNGYATTQPFSMTSLPGSTTSYPALLQQVSTPGLIPSPTPMSGGNASIGGLNGYSLGGLSLQGGLPSPDPLADMAALADALPELNPSQGLSGALQTVPGGLM